MRRYSPAFILTTPLIAALSWAPAPLALADLQDDDQIEIELPLEPEAEAPEDGPLVLSVLDDQPDQGDNAKSETEAGEGDDAEPEAESLPKAAIQKSTDVIDEEEMKALSQQPLFKEFANAVEEIAPMTPIVEGSELNVPGAEYFNGYDPEGADALATPTTQPKAIVDADRLQLLESSLALADSVDLASLALSVSQRATLESIDAEIARLWPMWIEAELNRDVVGRRERDWRGRDPFRYSVAGHKVIDAPGSDWALALDEPFFFRVFDRVTGEEFYTKAGDFEQSIDTGEIVLFREERVLTLDVEPGLVAPTGRARRAKILKDGRVQGVDESGRLVTDVNLGQIALYTFANSSRLKAEDGVFFVPTPYSGAPTRVKLPANSKIGVNQRQLALSNGVPEEIFTQLVALCKSKQRLIEILTQPRLPREPAIKTRAPIKIEGDEKTNQDLIEPEVDPELAPDETPNEGEAIDDEFLLDPEPEPEPESEKGGGVLQPPFLRPEIR